jgi:hypothetical protein
MALIRDAPTGIALGYSLLGRLKALSMAAFSRLRRVVLSTILDRHGLLDQFKRDFLRAHTGLEARQEYANLRPIKDVFGEGPRLAPLPMVGSLILQPR